MTPKKVVFAIVKRTNRFSKKIVEYSLTAQFIGDSPWTICSWDYSPSEKEINIAKEIVLRSFEIYHKSIEMPRYSMDVVDQTL